MAVSPILSFRTDMAIAPEEKEFRKLIFLFWIKRPLCLRL